MSHPIPDPNPPALVIGRIHRTTAEVRNNPETWKTSTLTQILAASLELSETVNRALRARGAL